MYSFELGRRKQAQSILNVYNKYILIFHSRHVLVIDTNEKLG